MAFGGVNGLNIFNPDEVNENEYRGDVIFTGFKIGNKEVPLSTNGKLLSKNIFATSELRLNHTENFISFSFASTDYSSSGNMIYQYMLNVLDSDWLPST